MKKCFVGSGGCNNPVTHTVDNGEGRFVDVCAHHFELMEAWEVVISKMSPEKRQAFEKAVEEAHSKL